MSSSLYVSQTDPLMSEETLNLDSQLPPTDSLSTLLKMHWNLAPNEPPPATLPDRVLLSRRPDSRPVSEHFLDQGYTGIYSDDEDTFTVLHTQEVTSRNLNHNQSNNYVPARLNRNNGTEYGLNGLSHLNHQHQHRHMNNLHNRNNHVHRRNSLSYQLQRRVKRLMRRVYKLITYGVPMLVGVILGVVLFLFLLRTPQSQQEDNFLLSKDCSQIPQKCCITDETIHRDLEVARTIEIFLSNQAGYHECGYKNYVTAQLSREQLNKKLNESKFKFYIPRDKLTEALEHAIWLFAHNSHWGVSLYTGEDVVYQENDSLTISSFTRVEKLFSHKPYRPIQCLVFLTVYHALVHTWKYLAVLCLNLAILFLYYFIHQKRMGDLEEMFAIIRKIANILRKDYIATKRHGGITKYHLITHIRDQIIPDKNRASKEKLWRKAVEYIRCNDSRVRNETRRVGGVEVEVWKWIELEPMPTNSDEVKERMSCWQGRALDDYPPGVDSKVAPPNGTPSQCFRVEHVFKNVTKMLDHDTAYYAEYSILDQCIPHGGVLGIKVDRRSQQGCVYVKMESVQAAAGAYRALHGAWYKRQMLIVKYMSSQKYNELFKNYPATKKSIYPPM